MQEIEILVELIDPISVARSAMENFAFKGKKKTIDVYYYDPLRDNLKMNTENKILECCRIRSKNDEYFITYKVDIYEGEIWSHSDEYETKVGKLDEIMQILKCLGLKELVTVDNTKYTYITKNYEIVIEDVVGLGCFLEVEILIVPDEKTIPELKKEVYEFINSLGLHVGPELNSGKPELLLIKNINRN